MRNLSSAFEASIGNRALALASVGAGASNWHFNAGGDFGPEHARRRCCCGDLAPSRPHLAWACESFAECRVGIESPADRAAERLLARPVSQHPPAPVAIDLRDFQEELQACVALHIASPIIFLATDGSSREDVGSFAVTVQDALNVFAAGDDAEDQTPFRMELQAIVYALRAAASACTDPQLQHLRRCRRLFLAVDCQSAIAAIEGTGGFDYLLLLLEIRHHRRRLLQYGVRAEFIWTPAHGRCATWMPTRGHDPAYLRALNAAADKAANDSMTRRWANSARRAWRQQLALAEKWEWDAVHMVANIADRHHAYLKTLGTRPRE